MREARVCGDAGMIAGKRNHAVHEYHLSTQSPLLSTVYQCLINCCYPKLLKYVISESLLLSFFSEYIIKKKILYQVN